MKVSVSGGAIYLKNLFAGSRHGNSGYKVKMKIKRICKNNTGDR